MRVWVVCLASLGRCVSSLKNLFFMLANWWLEWCEGGCGGGGSLSFSLSSSAALRSRTPAALTSRIASLMEPVEKEMMNVRPHDLHSTPTTCQDRHKHSKQMRPFRLDPDWPFTWLKSFNPHLTHFTRLLVYPSASYLWKSNLKPKDVLCLYYFRLHESILILTFSSFLHLQLNVVPSQQHCNGTYLFLILKCCNMFCAALLPEQIDWISAQHLNLS